MMSHVTTYLSTITAKGQITLPAAIRRQLGLEPGDRVRLRLDGGRAAVEPAETLANLQARIKAEATAQGTWGLPLQSGDGWTAHVESDHA